MSKNILFPMLAAVTLTACDRDNTAVLEQPDLDSIIEIGEMQVLTRDQFAEFQASSDPTAWCDETDDLGRPRCFFGQVASSFAAFRGGATFTFRGIDEDVCLIVDPETVFWSQSIAASNPETNYLIPDVLVDDGDVDIFAGLSSYYTGSPGIEIGDFLGFYTDSLGREVTIDYGACTQDGWRTGFNTAHAGRATVEYCTIDTRERAGVEYIAVLETFNVPVDDGALSFSAMVVEGPCGADRERIFDTLSVDECTIIGESLDLAEGDNPAKTIRSCTPQLELAYCGEELLPFCCANPEMCGENEDPLNTCAGVYGEDTTRDEWCAASGLCCDAGSSEE